MLRDGKIINFIKRKRLFQKYKSISFRTLFCRDDENFTFDTTS